MRTPLACSQQDVVEREDRGGPAGQRPESDPARTDPVVGGARHVHAVDVDPDLLADRLDDVAVHAAARVDRRDGPDLPLLATQQLPGAFAGLLESNPLAG